jgi:NADH dehydrogenase [ubiquinone] 1 alpha subcomplex assembly factor 6
MTHNYCREVVREYDPDRYLLSLFCKAKRRPALWALFAFNHEIAKTREVVSETKLGLIRLQWWRDAIGQIYESLDAGGEALEHEVLRALAVAIKDYDLPREMFDRLIYAREFDLEDVAPANMEGLKLYLSETSVPLWSLALHVLGEQEDEETLNTVAVNYALQGILRSVPFHASQRRCYLPADLLQDNGVRIEGDLYEFKNKEGVLVAIRSVADMFVGECVCNYKFLRKINGLSLLYKSTLNRVGCDVYDSRAQIPPAFKELRLLFS